MNMQTRGLRPYQSAALRHIIEELDPGRRAHACLPTGSGKSRVLVEVARHILDGCTAGGPPPAGTVLVVSPRRQITAQLSTAMAMTGYETASLPGAGTVAAPIIVGTAVTLRRWIERAGADPLLVLIDEAHHATAAGCRALLDTVPEILRVGVTATPYRHDGNRLDDVLGRCVFLREPDHPDMAGVLAPVEWQPVRLPVDLDEVAIVSTSDGRDYQPSTLGAVLTTPEAIAATVEGTAVAVAGRLSLVFAVNLAHARLLADAYRREGLRVGCVFGVTPAEDRADMVGRLARGLVDSDGLDMLVTVGALTEGFDCPQVSALVIARPTRSELLYTQMIGRGLRVSPGKTSCVVLDLTGRDTEAGPTATGQIFAPTVITSTVGEAGEADADQEGAATWWNRGRGSSRQMIGTDRRSPRWAWSPGPEGTLTVPLSAGRTGVLQPDGDSGLWIPAIVGPDGSTALAGPLPSRHAVDSFAGLESASLTRADTRWRSDLPTTKQLDMLKRVGPAAAQAAVGEGWSKGRVSDVLSGYLTSRRLLVAAR